MSQIRPMPTRHPQVSCHCRGGWPVGLVSARISEQPSKELVLWNLARRQRLSAGKHRHIFSPLNPEAKLSQIPQADQDDWNMIVILSNLLFFWHCLSSKPLLFEFAVIRDSLALSLIQGFMSCSMPRSAPGAADITVDRLISFLSSQSFLSDGQTPINVKMSKRKFCGVKSFEESKIGWHIGSDSREDWSLKLENQEHLYEEMTQTEAQW